ncbi:DUF2264 domain-containing protein [Streptomyces sp. ADI93-02]|uniref:DUF2264 domain-containing protein n=1 Tax=Streptomyces sp. ADI93-02 TaxID=1522757 RepID=UPI000F54F3A1|nr:DUF2264 domain-containing protein [Streptomyces sp. ADI93-02]RPK49120.1 hypothetical protein EES40_08010 [Streptomyces sp. ADI93-02]
MWQLPPEDRTTSPYTGWTRAHWEAVADSLLAAVREHASPGGALISLPGPASSSGPRSDGLEGYARTFLLAAFRVTGAGGDDPHGMLSRYADGLAAGTRTPGRDDAESWPRPSECGQAWVEAASIALGLRLTRPWLWDRLDKDVQERAADWMSEALGTPPVNNNWWLFPLTVGGFLAEAGHHEEASRAAIQRGLAKIETWYEGGGWYTDGPERSFDHYNGWAMHLYPMLHARLSNDGDTLARYGGRLREFLADYSRLFAADGSPLPIGRSLTYRFATASALWAGALTGHTPLAAGATRRIASGALRYFTDRDAADDGLLSMGWHGPYPPVVQEYSGPASPYWAAKAFVGLLLPADHPEWTAVERAAPVEAGDSVTALPAPGWLVQATAADGVVRVHNHGSDGQIVHPERDDPLYARLAYSTHTGPTEPGAAPDNHFGLVEDGRITRRGRITPLGSGDGWTASVQRTPAGTARLASMTLARGAAEVRIHRVEGAAPGTRVRASGWAVDGNRTVSALHPVYGFDGPAGSVPGGPTAYAEATRMPVAEGTVGDGLFVCCASLSGTGPGTAPAFPDVQVNGPAVRITWPGGEVQVATLTADTATVAPGDSAGLRERPGPG